MVNVTWRNLWDFLVCLFFRPELIRNIFGLVCWAGVEMVPCWKSNSVEIKIDASHWSMVKHFVLKHLCSVSTNIRQGQKTLRFISYNKSWFVGMIMVYVKESALQILSNGEETCLLVLFHAKASPISAEQFVRLLLGSQKVFNERLYKEYLLLNTLFFSV